MAKVILKRQHPSIIMDGFDKSAAPDWLMVPKGERRDTLVLLNGKGETIWTTNAAFVKLVDPATNRWVDALHITSHWQVITFEGLNPGTATIYISHNKKGYESYKLLEVCVLAKKEISVAFHYLEDSKGRKPKRKEGGEAALLKMVNKVYQPQANITFTKLSAGKLKVAEDLGNPITNTSLGGWDLPLLHKWADKSAGLNVFFSWEYKSGGTGDTADAEVDQIGCREVIYEDNVGMDEGLALAHEFGHNLGLAHQKKSTKQLMWEDTAQVSGVMDKSEVLIVHKNA